MQNANTPNASLASLAGQPTVHEANLNLKIGDVSQIGNTLYFEVHSATTGSRTDEGKSAISKEMIDQIQAKKWYKVSKFGPSHLSDGTHVLQTRPAQASNPNDFFDDLSVKGETVDEIWKLKGLGSTLGFQQKTIPTIVYGRTRNAIEPTTDGNVGLSTSDPHLDGRITPTFEVNSHSDPYLDGRITPTYGDDLIPSLITPPGSVYSNAGDQTV